MRTILLWMFWLMAVGGAFRLLALAVLDYPRTIKREAWEESIGVAQAIVWCVWIGVTIW